MRLAEFTRARHGALNRALDRGGLDHDVAAIALSAVAGLSLRAIADDLGMSIVAVSCIVGCWAVCVSEIEPPLRLPPAELPGNWPAEARFA